MKTLTDELIQAAQESSRPDRREQAIIDRHKTGARKESLFQEIAQGEAELEIDVRRQQRAYAEKPPTALAQMTVDPAREMVANLGDRARVLDVYRKLSPEQRQEALNLVPGIAQMGGDDRGGFTGRVGSAVARGITGVSQPIMELLGGGGSAEEIEFIRKLEGAASQEFNPALPGDPWYERGPVQALEMLPWMATTVGGAGLGRAAATGIASRVAARAAAGSKVASVVQKAGQAVGSLPTKVPVVGKYLPAVTAGKAGELAGITAAAFPAQYAQEVDQLKAIGMVDDTRLRLLAGGTAAVTGLVEGIVPNPFGGKVALTEGAAKAARQYLWEAAKKAPGELTEEYLQGVTSGLGEHVAQYIGSEVEKKNADGTTVKINPAQKKTIADAFSKGWKQTQEAALPMAFLLGGSAIGGAGMSAAQARYATPASMPQPPLPTQPAIGDTMSPPPLPTQPPALPTQPPAVPPTQQSPDPIAQRIKSLEKAPSAHKWAEVVLGDRKRFKEAPDEATRIQQWEQARGVDAGQPAQDQSVPTDEAQVKSQYAEEIARRRAAKAGAQPEVSTEVQPTTPPPLPASKQPTGNTAAPPPLPTTQPSVADVSPNEERNKLVALLNDLNEELFLKRDNDASKVKLRDDTLQKIKEIDSQSDTDSQPPVQDVAPFSSDEQNGDTMSPIEQFQSPFKFLEEKFPNDQEIAAAVNKYGVEFVAEKLGWKPPTVTPEKQRKESIARILYEASKTESEYEPSEVDIPPLSIEQIDLEVERLETKLQRGKKIDRNDIRTLKQRAGLAVNQYANEAIENDTEAFIGELRKQVDALKAKEVAKPSEKAPSKEQGKRTVAQPAAPEATVTTSEPPSKAVVPVNPGWDVIQDTSPTGGGRFYREDPNPNLKPSQRASTRVAVDPSEGVVLVTKDQFGNAIKPDTLKARKEFIDGAKEGATFRRPGFNKNALFEVGKDGKIYSIESNSKRESGSVQELANVIQPEDIKELARVADSSAGKTPVKRFDNGVTITAQKDKQGNSVPVTFHEGREIVHVVDDKGRGAWFYRSFTGKGGKQQGRWYPVGGVASNKDGTRSWIIKGDPVNDKGFGRPDLAKLEDMVNDVLPSSDEDVDKFLASVGAKVSVENTKAPSQLTESTGSGPYSQEEMGSVLQKWKDDYLTPVWGSRESSDKPAKRSYRKDNPSEAKAGDIVSPESKRDQEKQDAPQTKEGGDPNEVQTEGRQRSTEGQVSPKDEGQTTGETPSPDSSEVQKAVSGLEKMYGEKVRLVDTDKLSEEQQEAIDFIQSKGKALAFYEVNAPSIGWYQVGTDVILVNNKLEGDALWGAVGHELAHATGLDEAIPFDSAELQADMEAYYEAASPRYKKYLKTNKKTWEREGRARMVQRFFEDSDFRDSLKQSNPTMWENIREAILKFIGQWAPEDAARKKVLEELRAAKKPNAQASPVVTAEKPTYKELRLGFEDYKTTNRLSSGAGSPALWQQVKQVDGESVFTYYVVDTTNESIVLSTSDYDQAKASWDKQTELFNVNKARERDRLYEESEKISKAKKKAISDDLENRKSQDAQTVSAQDLDKPLTGKPIIVTGFHGSKEVFEEFDPSRRGETDPGFLGPAYYFYADEALAKQHGENVIRRDLRINKPLDYAQMMAAKVGSPLREVNERYDEVYDRELDIALAQERKGLGAQPAYWRARAAALATVAKEFGYDGVVMRGGVVDDFPSTEIAVFDPPQQTKASPSAQPDKLKQYGLKVERVGSRWVVSGKTFSNKQILKDVGGQYDVSEKNWWFRSDPTDEIAAQLPDKGDGEQSGDGGDSDADVERKRVRSREAERPDERGTRDSVVESVGDDTKQLIQRGEKFGIPKKVLEGQVEDIGRVTQAFEASKPMFLVGSAPGMGKSFILGGSIAEIRKRIKANGGTPRFIYVTENQELIGQLKRDLADYGVEDVEFVTYAGVRGKRPNANGSVVLVDEAHNAKNLETKNGEAIQSMVSESDFTVYATATPFENVAEAKYLEASGVFDGVEAVIKRKDDGGKPYDATIVGFDAWAFAYGAELYWPKNAPRPVIYWHKHTTAEEGQIQANDWMAARGVYTQRPMVLPPEMVKSDLRAVTVDDKYAEMFEDVLGAYAEAEANAENAMEAGMIRAHGINLQKRILEASKVNEGIARAKDLIADGKQVIIFVNTKADRAIGRYKLSEPYRKHHGIKGEAAEKLYAPSQIADMMDEYQLAKRASREMGGDAGPAPFAKPVAAIAEAMGSRGIDFSLPSVTDELLSAFPDGKSVEYTGRLTDAKAKDNLGQWKSGKAKVIVATMDKGGTGLSYHDTTGKMPERVQVNINLPWSGTQVEQVSGRLARLGTAKPVGIEWIFADNILFERELSKTVGSRMRSMQAAVQGSLGDMAQSIKDFEFGDAPSIPEVTPQNESRDRVQQIQDAFPLNREQAITADILMDAMALPGEIEIALPGTPIPGDSLSQSEGPLSNVDADAIPKAVLDKMSRRLKSMGYDTRGAEDVRRAIKQGSMLNHHADYIAAYRFATGSEQARKDKAATKQEFKNVNWSRLNELGTTTDPKEAGYIKPDGTFADLSGKREGGSRGARSFDHREAGGTAGMQEVMAYGWVRMDENSGSVDIAKLPTAQQLSAITRMAERHNGELVVDLEDGLGEWSQGNEYYRTASRRWSQQYPEGTRPKRIINDIKKFFDGDTPNTLFQKQSGNTADMQTTGVAFGYEFATGQPVTFTYRRNTESATGIFGKPKKGDRYGRDLEPSGEYMIVSSDSKDPGIKNWIAGERTFQNPLVIETPSGKPVDWKKNLSKAYGGKAGKKLSLAIIADGFDGIVTVADQGGIGEVVDLTTFEEGKALFQKQRDRQGTIQAWTHFVNASKAVIGATDQADVSSFFHELGHPMRRFLFNRDVPQDERGNITDEDIGKIEDFVGVEYDVDGKPKWDTPAEERFVDALMSYWMEGKAPTKQLETIFQKISQWLSDVLSVITRKVDLTDDVRSVFDKVHQRGGIDPKKMQSLKDASSESKAVEQEMPKAASGEVRDVLDDLFGDEVPSEVRVEALDKIKDAGIKIKQTKKGWSVTGLPKELSQEIKDGIEAAGGLNREYGYFFKDNPTSRLSGTAEAIIRENQLAAEAAEKGFVRTRLGDIESETAEWYESERAKRIKVLQDIRSAAIDRMVQMISNFVAKKDRGMFAIKVRQSVENGDYDDIKRFDEMAGLARVDEEELYKLLQERHLTDEEIESQVDAQLALEFQGAAMEAAGELSSEEGDGSFDELVSDMFSEEGDGSFDFGFDADPEQLRQTAIEGLEDDVARKESSELFDAKQDKYKQKLKAEIPKMKQQMFLTDIDGNADQGTLFDTDGIAQEDDDLLFQASESPVRQAGRVLKSAIESGVKTFEDFITHAKTQLRDDQILQNASNLETLWSELRSRGGRFAELGPVGSAAELLKPVRKNSESKIGDTMSPIEEATTGTKHAKTDELRAKSGLPERISPYPETFQEWEDQASREYPDAASRLKVVERVEREKHASKIENAVIGQHIVDLENRRNAGEDVLDELLRAIKASTVAGSEAGRDLVSRRAERYSDFSLAGIIGQHIDTAGKDPTEEQLAKYEELADRIKKLENEKLELAEKLAKEAIARKKAEEAAKPKPQPAKDKPETKQEVQQKNVAVAVASFKDKWNSLFSTGETFFQDKGYDPEENRNKIIQAATEVIKAYGADVTSFLELQSQLKGFGIDITDLAAQQTKAFKAAWDAYQKKNKVMSPIGVNPEKSAIGARAKDLMKLALEAGYGATPKTWKEVVDVVHAQLSIEVPGISEYDTMQALSDYGVWRPLNKEEIAVKTRAIRGKARQSLKIEDAIKAIAQSEAWLKSGMSPEEVARRLRDMNWLPKATGSEQATPDSIERELIAEFNKLKKDLPVSAESREGQLKSALTTAKTAGRNRLELLDKDIKALEEAIATPKELVKPVDERTALKPDEDLLAIRKQLEVKRKQRDDLKAKYETIFPSTKPKIGRKPLTDEQRLAMSERMLQSQINAVKEDMKALEAGTWTPAVKSDAPTSIAKEALKAELATLKQAREQARQSSPAYQARKEAKYWEQYRKSQEKRLEFWEKRRDDAAAGNIPAPLKKRTITEESILDRNLEIEKVQYEAMYEIEKAKRENWNAGQWINHGLLEVTSLIPKTLMLGMEMSYVLRQGFFYARAHPIKAFTALVDSIPAVWSQRLALASMEDIKSRPNAKEYELAKIDFTQKTGPQAKLEEMYQSSVIQWLERTENKFLLPLRTWVKLYGMFESGNRTFANIMKADLYDIQKRDTLAARELFGVSTDWTESDIKETGRIANIFSGRGTGLKGGSPWLDFFFLARRWLWSRLQADFVVPVQLMTPKMIGQWNADRGMRAALAKLYIQTFLGHATKLAMAYFAYSILAGDDEEDKPTMEWDPRASDAWSLKIGETRIKDEGGLMPAIVLAARIATGEMKTSSGEIKSIYGEDVQYGGKAVDDFVIDFARYKLGTGPSAALELMSGRDSVGKVIAKKDDPLAVPKHIVTSRITPLTWREIAAAEKELGVANGTLASLESFFGVSVSTHGDRTEYRQANAAEKEKKFDKDIKKMKFDSPDPAYKEFLSKEQMSQVSERREDRRQGLVYEASSNPVRKSFKNDKTFDQAVRERDAALENMKKSGMSLDEARGLLIKHWESNYGGAKETRGGVRVYKEALSDRLRQLRKAFPQ